MYKQTCAASTQKWTSKSRAQQMEAFERRYSYDEDNLEFKADTKRNRTRIYVQHKA